MLNLKIKKAGHYLDNFFYTNTFIIYLLNTIPLIRNSTNVSK